MTSTSAYRIANAAGFWGDRNDALLEQVTEGPVDVVMLDYLAEVTMSILRKQMQRDDQAGWATDFLTALEPALPIVAERGIVVVTNAGGMNPRACAEAVADAARKRGVRIPIGIVSGDDLMPRLDQLTAGGAKLDNTDTGAALESVRSRVLSANAYLGAAPIADALGRGAKIVVTGRTTDSALALGPLIARYGWRADDWNRLASGIVAGHLLECGTQVTGGNFNGGWQRVPRMEDIGFPIAEVEENGDFVLTKHASLGGMVTLGTVKEQLLYEIGDPRAYLTPDVAADFTSLSLEDLGGDRVRVHGVRGKAPPKTLKVSMTVAGGFRCSAAMTFVAPGAVERARAAERILLARCKKLGIELVSHNVELVGISAAHGPMAKPAAEPNEVLFRMTVRTNDAKNAERFAREIPPLFLAGPSGIASGPGLGGRPDVQPIVDFWPTLVAASEVTPNVEVLEP